MKRRAAVVIGVNKGGSLQPLRSAARTAQSIARWLANADPGYEVAFLNDAGLVLDGAETEPTPVTISEVQRAVRGYVTVPPRYDLLLLYYCGHGLFTARHDVWLLNGAPETATEVISVNSSMDLAEVCGVPTVVFVSDACRDVSGALTMQQLSPGPVFPNLSELSNSVCQVDLIRATLRGAAAYEIPIGTEVSPLLSHALRAAYSEPEPSMIAPIEHDGKRINVVPNRRLAAFLQARINKAVDAAERDIQQTVHLIIPSSDLTFIAPVDPSVGCAGDPAEPAPVVLNAAEASPDDLKRIRGIGATREKMLNEFGVTRFQQIAGWTPEDIARVDDALGLRSSILRYDWVGQARWLAAASRDPFSEVLSIEFGVGESPPANRPRLRASRPRGRGLHESDLEFFSAENRSPTLEDPFQGLKVEPPPAVSRPEIGAGSGLGRGFILSGASVACLVTGARGGNVEILSRGDGAAEPARVRVGGAPAQIGVVLDDGRSLLIPALDGHVGQYHVAAAGLSEARLMPAGDTARWQGLAALRERARLELEGSRLLVRTFGEAGRLSTSLALSKTLDPMLGLFAAWSYHEAGYPAEIGGILDRLRREIGVDLFDIRLLAYRRPWSEIEGWPCVPSCPMLTQGWHILGARGVTLPPLLAEGISHLSDSLFTTFHPPFADRLITYLEEDRDQ